MQRKCCLAATMTLENSHELMNLAEEKSKAALCYVTEKVAKHFLSKCEDFEEVSVVGDASLKEIVHSVITPPPKKRKTKDNADDNTASHVNKDGSKDNGKESRDDKGKSNGDKEESNDQGSASPSD
jgi:hypothetical protein